MAGVRGEAEVKTFVVESRRRAVNDSDLKSQFESLRVPERQADYWDGFPDQVLAQLRRREAVRRVPEPTFVARLSWHAGVVFGCLVACFCLWQACTGPVSHVIQRQKKEVREALLQLHDNMGKVMRDEHGLQRLIEEPQ
jgi:hypothetical protein